MNKITCNSFHVQQPYFYSIWSRQHKMTEISENFLGHCSD